MVQFSMSEEQLDGFHVSPLLDQPARHRAPATVRRPTPYTGVPVQLWDV